MEGAKCVRTEQDPHHGAARFRSQRCPTTKPSGYSWSSRGWSQPSKVRKGALRGHEGGGGAPASPSRWSADQSQPNCIVLFPNCVTALLMWVKVCPPS